MSGIFSKIKELVKSGDLFGVKVQLTYKGVDKFKTFCGGCATLFFLLTMVLYFAYEFDHVYHHPQYWNTPPNHDWSVQESQLYPQYGNIVAISLESYEREEIQQNYRVQYFLRDFVNKTVVDAVYCSDLYATQLANEANDSSTHYQYFTDVFSNRNWICPNLTQTLTLSRNISLHAEVVQCGQAQGDVYAKDIECQDQEEHIFSNAS